MVTLTSLVEASAAWWELESWSWAAGISGGGCRSLASCSVRHRDWGCSSWCLSEWPLSLLAQTNCQIYPEFGHCSSPQCGVWTVHVIPLEMWCSWGGDVLPVVVPRYVLPNIEARHPSHCMQYTVPLCFCLSSLSFGLTSCYLRVLTGLKCTVIPFLLNTRRKASELPLRYGIVTLPLYVIGLSRRRARCWHLSLLTRWNCQSEYPHLLSTSLMFLSRSFHLLSMC